MRKSEFPAPPLLLKDSEAQLTRECLEILALEVFLARRIAISKLSNRKVFSLECAGIGGAARVRQGIRFLGTANRVCGSGKWLWKYQKLLKAQ